MGIIKKVIYATSWMVFPLSHRERGNEGERPINQTKQYP
jgi:hypothetical protein